MELDQSKADDDVAALGEGEREGLALGVWVVHIVVVLEESRDLLDGEIGEADGVIGADEVLVEDLTRGTKGW